MLLSWRTRTVAKNMQHFFAKLLVVCEIDERICNRACKREQVCKCYQMITDTLAKLIEPHEMMGKHTNSKDKDKKNDHAGRSPSTFLPSFLRMGAPRNDILISAPVLTEFYCNLYVTVTDNA